MADAESTSSDTSSDAVDTSVSSADTSTDEDEDVDLEDIEVSLEDMDSSTDPEEEQATEPEEDIEEAEATDEQAEEDAESSDEEDAEPTEDEKQAAFRREMYEKRQQEKEQRLSTQKEEQQQYLAEAEDAHELALRQLQIDAYDNKVERNASNLQTSYERAVKDFDVLSTDDPVIQAEINREIDAFQALHVTIDGYGNPTDIRGDLYATLQAKADSIEKLTGIRAKRQEQSKAREKSKTLATPNRAPQKPKKDPDMEAFDEEAWS